MENAVGRQVESFVPSLSLEEKFFLFRFDYSGGIGSYFLKKIHEGRSGRKPHCFASFGSKEVLRRVFRQRSGAESTQRLAHVCAGTGMTLRNELVTRQPRHGGGPARARLTSLRWCPPSQERLPNLTKTALRFGSDSAGQSGRNHWVPLPCSQAV